MPTKYYVNLFFTFVHYILVLLAWTLVWTHPLQLFLLQTNSEHFPNLKPLIFHDFYSFFFFFNMFSLPLSLLLHILQSWVVLHLQSCEIRVTLVPLCQSLYLHIAGVFNSLIVYMIHFVSNLKSQVFLFGFLWRSLTRSFILKNGKILFKIQKKEQNPNAFIFEWTTIFTTTKYTESNPKFNWKVKWLLW